MKYLGCGSHIVGEGGVPAIQRQLGFCATSWTSTAASVLSPGHGLEASDLLRPSPYHEVCCSAGSTVVWWVGDQFDFLKISWKS